MHLGVNEGAVILEPFESVAGVAVHVMIAIRSATIREQDHNLMNGLWVLRKIVLKTQISILVSQQGEGIVPRTYPHLSNVSEGSSSGCG